MELKVLDPFGDYQTAGYLRNAYSERNLKLVGRLETAAFRQEVLATVRYLRRRSALGYADVLEVHRQLFGSLYPWAGSDRSITAPHLAIVKAGYSKLFSHPADCQRAAEYALSRGQDLDYLRTRPGEVFGYLAHAHPFLEGNGRTILTMFAELTRRANFFILWEEIETQVFLRTLTEELHRPGKGIMDALVSSFVEEGTQSAAVTARRLRHRFEKD